MARKSNSKKAHDKAQAALQGLVDKVIAAIEDNPGEWTKPWKSLANTGLPVNLVSGKTYRGTNSLIFGLLSFERGYTSPVWATYRQWSQLGAQVRKGETGTLGVFYKQLKIEEENDEGKKETKRIPLLRSFVVFNADQVEVPADSKAARRLNKLVGPKVELTPTERIEQAERFFAAVGSTVHEVRGNRAFYDRRADAITVPVIDQYEAPESFYATLCHEHIHWTGAEHRLDRTKGKRFGDEDYAREELVAELGAVFVAAHLGIESEPHPEHAKYLASWLKGLKENPTYLSKSATKAAAALDFLVTEAGDALDVEPVEDDAVQQAA